MTATTPTSRVMSSRAHRLFEEARGQLGDRLIDMEVVGARGAVNGLKRY
jgi:hypothetical protein